MCTLASCHSDDALAEYLFLFWNLACTYTNYVTDISSKNLTLYITHTSVL